nr:hypothetical protein [Tanacetum cinerariifolium]
MHLNRGIISKINVDEDVILEEVDVENDAKVIKKNVDIQGRLEESQAKVYHIDLEHADKVLSQREGKTRQCCVEVSSIEEEATDRSPSHKEYDGLPKNMAGFKMGYFKGMSYDDIRLIFEKYFNSNVAFLEKSKEELEEEESIALKRKTKCSEEKAVKKCGT